MSELASPAPWNVLIVDDDPGIRQSLRLCLESGGATVHQVGSAQAAFELLGRKTFEVLFLDLWLGKDSGLQMLPEILRLQPSVGVVVVTAFASYESAVEAMKLGALDYLPKPFTPQQVRAAASRILDSSRLRMRLSELAEQVQESESELVFDTQSRVYAKFLETASRAAASDAVILLRGESGTGKTTIARWLRKCSRRPEGPFVTVHCPLLAGELMSSTLFGHRKGAFTGAVQDTIGKIEHAEGGTLFLDEVTDLTADAQSRLLRFLNDKTYERVGDAIERTANVRLIAATNRSIEQEVDAGNFREDLLYRLNVIPLIVPALRERHEDILALADHYLRFFQRRQQRGGLTFSDQSQYAIGQHRWPGNLRELRNSVERAVILAPCRTIQPEDLGLPSYRAKTESLGTTEGAGSVNRDSLQLGSLATLESIEREHIARVLVMTPSFDAAAKVLGIDVTTLKRKRKRYGLM